jgi:putative ubiquitin-RnfH superfamily antitoxin RatB of RatAB toxin-antitoxin module
LAASIRVEVAYALAQEQCVVELRVAAGATLRDVIARSGVLERFRDIDLARCGVGVFGKARGLDETVSDGDRVEIYRPLLADPKERRRQKAAAARKNRA